jgi:predicted Zn finger-like uncharacterized protein
MPKVSITCPGCRAIFSVDAGSIGRKARCKRCGARFVIEYLPSGLPGGERWEQSTNKLTDDDTASSRVTADDRVPTVWESGDVILDVYEVRDVLGEGGMGKVVRVHHRGWNLELAVKSPKPTLLRRPRAADRFEKEAETWVNLGLHPHVVSCFYVRRLGGIPRVFAEYVDGGSLKDWIDTRKLYEGSPREAMERILDVGIQVAWGLGYAHEKGLVHQDVKPANIMMTIEGVAKVTDFGLAKARNSAGETASASSEEDILVSYAGMTPAYCSPEQAANRSLSRATDVWSWALSFLEMLIGEVTWKKGTVAAEVLTDVLETGATEDHLPAIPRTVIDLLRACFSKEPGSRPSMPEVAESLQATYRELTGRDYARPIPKAAKLLADDLNNRAVSLLDVGQEEQAYRHITDALKADPHHIEATFNHGLLRWRRGQIADDVLIRELQQACASHVSNMWLHHYLLGAIALERGNAKAAVKDFEKALFYAPHETSIRPVLEIAHSVIGKSRGCVGALEGVSGDLHSASIVATSSDDRFALTVDGFSLRLWELDSSRCVKALEKHWDGLDRLKAPVVQAIAISHGGSLAVSGGWDEDVSLWDLRSGQPAAVLEGHRDWINSVCFNMDDSRILSASGGAPRADGVADNTLRMWDTASGKCIDILDSRPTPINAVCASDETNIAVSGGRDAVLRVWNLDSRQCTGELRGHTDGVTSVSITRRGHLALSSSSDGSLLLWDLTSGQCRLKLLGHKGKVVSAALSADGRVAFSGGEDGSIRLWDVAAARCVWSFNTGSGVIGVSNVCITRSGDTGLTAGSGGARIWNLCAPAQWQSPALICRAVKSEDRLKLQVAYENEMNATRRALQGDDFATAALHLRLARNVPGHLRHHEAVQAWNELYTCLRRESLKDVWAARRLEGHCDGVTSIDVTEDGTRLLSAGRDGTLRVWNTCTGDCLRVMETHANAICVSDDGVSALSGGDRAIRLWELDSGKCVSKLPCGSDVQAIRFAPGAAFAASGHGDGTVAIWDLRKKVRLFTIAAHDSVTSVCFTPNAKFVITAGYDKYVRIWDAGSGGLVRELRRHREVVFSVFATADGRFVLSGSGDKSLKLWDICTGQRVANVFTHSVILDGRTSIDGRFAISGDHDSTVKIWDIHSESCLRTLSGHAGPVRCVGMSNDARFAFSGSEDGSVIVWQMDWELSSPAGDWKCIVLPHIEAFLSARLSLRSDRQLEHEGSLKNGCLDLPEATWAQLCFRIACLGYSAVSRSDIREVTNSVARMILANNQ